MLPIISGRNSARPDGTQAGFARSGSGNRKLRPTLRVLAMAPMLFVGGCGSFCPFCDYPGLSEAPPQSANTQPFEPRLSTLNPTMVISYEVLTDATNKATDPLRVRAEGSSEIAHWRVALGPVVFFDGSLDTNYSLDAAKSGPAAVDHVSDALHVSLPVHAGGQIGFGGAIAQLLSLNAKNYAVDFTGEVLGRIEPDADFNPTLKNQSVRVDLHGATVQLIGRNCIGIHGFEKCVGPVDLDVSGLVHDPLQNGLNSAAQNVTTLLPADEIHNKLQQVWRGYSVPISLGAGNNYFLNIRPTALSMPPALFDDRGAHLTASLAAYASVDAPPGSVAPITPLPRNVPAPGQPGDFSLSLPITLAYAAIRQQIAPTLVGKRFDFDTPAGVVKLWPKAIQIYSSGSKIVIGVQFVVKAPDRVFSTSGTVWFAGDLSMDASGQKLMVSDIAITRRFSNPIWTFVADLLQGRIQDGVKDGFSRDLSGPLNDAAQSIDSGLTRIGDGQPFTVAVSNTSVRVGKIYTGTDALTVEGLVNANVVLNLGGLAGR